VIVSPAGYLLTNNHVVEGADDIEVSLGDGRSARAKLIGTDPESDIAVLKIDLDKLPVLAFGDVDHAGSATSCWRSATRSTSARP
jgi:S1-C subfamily serine protease